MTEADGTRMTEDTGEDLELEDDAAAKIGGGETPAGTGKVQVKEFTISKQTDTASP